MTANVPAPLDEADLTTARRLAREGCREGLIRQTLGLSVKDWRALKQQDDSPLLAALDVGLAEGAAEIIAFMREQMREGSTEAAKWLGERVYKLHAPRPDADANDVPRVIVNIGTPMSPEEYRRVIDIRPDALPGPS
jgi:hypothetical protein